MAKKADKPPAAVSVRDPLVLTALAAAATQIAVVWLPIVPLGIPDEWVWHRIAYDGPEAAMLFLGLLFAAPAAAIYLLMCIRGDSSFESASRRGRALWLMALFVAGFAWLWAIQDTPPLAYDRLGRAPLVLYFSGTSGYFTQAQSTGDFAAYLADYERLMSEGDVLHLGTHPPGLIALHRALLDVYGNSPFLVDLTLALRPESVRLSEEIIATLPQHDGSRLTRVELAELWGASLLVQFAAVATLIPLYHCVSRSFGPTVGWRAACLWPLVPVLAIFPPKADVFYPFLGMTLLACWHGHGPPGILRAAFAGVIFWFGMTLSLAMLPVAMLAGLISVQAIFVAAPESRRRIILPTLRDAAVVAAVFVSLTATVYVWVRLDLIAVWRWNFRNHAAFYESYERTYWKWLLVNPIELAFAVGMPVAACVAFACVKARSLASIVWPVGVVVAVLWLSGKNSGEAARLWMFLMPWCLWVAGRAWTGDSGAVRWRAILYLQLIVAGLTAIRVSGFAFTELIGGTG